MRVELHLCIDVEDAAVLSHAARATSLNNGGEPAEYDANDFDAGWQLMQLLPDFPGTTLANWSADFPDDF